MYTIPQESCGFIFSQHHNSAHILDQRAGKLHCLFSPDQYKKGILRGTLVGYTIQYQKNNFYCTHIHTIQYPPIEPYNLYTLYMLIIAISNECIPQGCQNKQFFDALLILYETQTQKILASSNSLQKKLLICSILFLLDISTESLTIKKQVPSGLFEQSFSVFINNIKNISQNFSTQCLASIDLWLLECLSMYTQKLHKKGPLRLNDIFT